MALITLLCSLARPALWSARGALRSPLLHSDRGLSSLRSCATHDDRRDGGTSEHSATDLVVRRLAAIVAAHERNPLPAAELRRSLQSITAALLVDVDTIGSLRVAELREQLAAHGLSTRGLKAELVERLLEARRASATTAVSSPAHAAPAHEVSGGSALDAPTPLSEETANAILTKLSCARRGPQTGIFTDGSCKTNPGPGGWGVVAVRDGVVLWGESGTAKNTTNNRMELSAIIAALRRIPLDESATIYSDSDLCVQSLNTWAAGWKRNNWMRKRDQPVKNVDLVREAYALTCARPAVDIKWLRGHAGSTWNEFADRLAGQGH